MGNQPSRKTTGYKSGGKHSEEMIRGVKRAIKQKDVEQFTKISVGGGLQIGGKGIVAASLLAACKAYSQYSKTPSANIAKISSDSILSTIENNKMSISRDGHSVLRSSISTALSSVKES